MNRYDKEIIASIESRGVKNQVVDSSCLLSELKIEKVKDERGIDMEQQIRKIEVIMTATMKGRDDDTPLTKSYVKGQKYFIGEQLAHVFIKQLKIAKEVKKDKSKAKGKAKKVDENKAVKVDENK